MTKEAGGAGVPGHGLTRTTRRQLKRGYELVARSTGAGRLVPGFLIVGAQRSGTTSMFKTLIQHPMVARPFLRKGVHFFDIQYDHGFDWYRGRFPLSITTRLRRMGAGSPITGESSPYYMFHPLAAARIARDLPGVRLIVLLRNPVERAYSGHSHELARGYETEPFERALELEEQRIAGERDRMLAEPGYDSVHWQHHAYVKRGQYHEQLVELERLVGRDRLCVVDSHDFFTQPAPVFAEVVNFLGLPPHEGIKFEQHNARARLPLSPDLQTQLADHFAPHDERLAHWWDRVPSWRR
ncbi:MAG: sulfotransferase domain-containing protein [Actinomycetota bacterium]|nr:sulfotransferase domain-containing protein [Actinomycetota bacterium]